MIIHIDLDCFFVSAERIKNPTLNGKPVAVGNRNDTVLFSKEKKKFYNNPESRGAFLGAVNYNKFENKNFRQAFFDGDKLRGMIVTASYEARAVGVKAPMILRDALFHCPNLIVLPSDMPFYQDLSRQLRDFLQTQIPILEQTSIDEFFGDLKGWVDDREVGDFIQDLKNEIYKRFSLPCSIGAANSKTISKVGTSSAKPFGTRVIFKKDEKSFLSPIPIGKIPGIGKAMGNKLGEKGYKTVGDILKYPDPLKYMKRSGLDILDFLNGKDTFVETNRVQKSIGISRRFDPILDRIELKRRALILAKHIAYSISKREVNPTTYNIRLKYIFGESTKIGFTEDRIFSYELLKEKVLDSLEKIDKYKNSEVISFSIYLSNFLENKPKTTSLLDQELDEKRKSLNDAMTNLQKKYGIDALSSGFEML